MSTCVYLEDLLLKKYLDAQFYSFFFFFQCGMTSDVGFGLLFTNCLKFNKKHYSYVEWMFVLNF